MAVIKAFIIVQKKNTKINIGYFLDFYVYDIVILSINSLVSSALLPSFLK